MRLKENVLKNIIKESLVSLVQEHAKSVAQQQFFGMVDAYKKGELDNDEVSKSVKDAADDMSMKQVKDFAKTKHKGLPDHVDESTFQNLNDMDNYSGEYSRGDRFDIYIDDQLEYHDIPEDAVDRICDRIERLPYDVNFEVKRLNESCTDGSCPYYGEKKDIEKAEKNSPDKPMNFNKKQTKLDEKLLRSIIREALKEISDDTVDSAYMKAMSDTNTLPYGTPKRVRRDLQLKNIGQMRNDRLGFDPIRMKNIMRQRGTIGDPVLDRKWATWQQNHDDRIAGKRVYDKEKGRWITKLSEKELCESVQEILVNVLAKYTKGEATAEQANKAIVDLANADNTKKIDESILRNIVIESLQNIIKERNNRSFYEYAQEYKDKNGKKLPDDVLKNAAKKNDERFHNRKGRVNEDFESEWALMDNLWNDDFCQTLRQLKTVVERDGIIDAAEAISDYPVTYSAYGSDKDYEGKLDRLRQTITRSVINTLSNYDIIYVIENTPYKINVRESNLPQAAQLCIKLQQLANTQINESYTEEGNYTHFAVNKATNKIINGWDYSEHDPEELKLYKKDYFINDLVSNGFDPKQYTILTIKGCKARGINPFDDAQWANQ